MALEFICRSAVEPVRVAVFPGAYNPPTIAHVEIARAARTWAQEVIWVLPRALPHKAYEGVGFDRRLAMLRCVIAGEDGFSLAVSGGGLYAEIADETRAFLGPAPEIGLVCGRDAAERIAQWDYGRPGFFEEMIQRYPLLVAARRGEYAPAGQDRERIIALPFSSAWEHVSSTEVRERIARGDDWQHLVPAVIREQVARFY